MNNRPIEFMFSSGATLSAAMASATKLRRNTVVAVSTGKLDQVTLSVDARTQDSMTIDESITSPSNKENNPTLLSTVTDSPKNHQLKKFSQSTPALPQLHYDLQDLGRSKSKQKKFLRHFPYVPRDERVLNRKCQLLLDIKFLKIDFSCVSLMTDYSCALVGDIFLQGNLYVTYNYFAFHSNVFGYVRKVSLITLDQYFSHQLDFCYINNRYLFLWLMFAK